jgi:16S rRNA (guanine527-N7)-methyltransferase
LFHVKHEGWTPEDLSPGQLADLDAYEQLLVDLAIPRGMVAGSDREHLRTRHILDSLRAVPYLEDGPAAVLDLGSGAGLPGVPIAIACPDLLVTLAEPRQARAAFLELTAERLDLPNVRVFARQANELSDRFDVCLARGFGGLSRTWLVARDLLRAVGEVIYWGGRTFRPDLVPDDARVRTIVHATLESGGPIVIMARQ